MKVMVVSLFLNVLIFGFEKIFVMFMMGIIMGISRFVRMGVFFSVVLKFFIIRVSLGGYILSLFVFFFFYLCKNFCLFLFRGGR